MKKQICFLLAVSALLLLTACQDGKSDGLEGSTVFAGSEISKSTPPTNPSAPETTTAITSVSEPAVPETTKLCNPFRGELAEVYQTVWEFLFAKESNTELWQNEYLDLYQFFAAEKAADGTLRYPLPLVNLVKLDWVRRERSRFLNFEKTDFSFGLTIERISAENGMAEVALESGVGFRYVDRNEPSFLGNDYEIFLKKINGKWLVYDFVTHWDFLSNEYRDKEFDEVAYLEEIVGLRDARPAPAPPNS